MLTLNLNTSVNLTDDDSINNTTTTTAFSDPDAIITSDYTDWDSKRVNILQRDEFVTFEPHFPIAFIMLETKYETDILLTQPEIVRNIVPEEYHGRVYNTAPDTLNHATTDIFRYVSVGDRVTIKAGLSCTPGEYTVVNKIDNQNIRLNAAFYTAGSYTDNVDFVVERIFAEQDALIRGFSKLKIFFGPFKKIKITSVSSEQNTIRTLMLGVKE